MVSLSHYLSSLPESLSIFPGGPFAQDFGSFTGLNQMRRRSLIDAMGGDLRSAISDYSAALRLGFGNLTILLSVPQIRALYPELNLLSDADVVRLMHDQFHPEVQYQGFADELLHNDGHYQISLINDVYEKRGDAYIQSGHFADGVNDFQRIYRGIPAFADSVERWRPLDQSHAPISYLLDVKSSVLSGTLKRVWVKRSEKSGTQVISFEFNCVSREMRTSVALMPLEFAVACVKSDSSWDKAGFSSAQAYIARMA
jgi:hypothetical protein